MKINLKSVIEDAGLNVTALREAILLVLLTEAKIKKVELLKRLYEKNATWTNHQILYALAEMQNKEILMKLSLNDEILYYLTPKSLVKIFAKMTENFTQETGEKFGNAAELTEEQFTHILDAAGERWEELHTLSTQISRRIGAAFKKYFE